MFASFLVVFVTFAASQALLAVKLADVLSHVSEAGKPAAQQTLQDGAISLA